MGTSKHRRSRPVRWQAKAKGCRVKDLRFKLLGFQNVKGISIHALAAKRLRRYSELAPGSQVHLRIARATNARLQLTTMVIDCKRKNKLRKKVEIQ